MKNLQAQILSSFVSYPNIIDDFLEKVPFKVFLPEAQSILKEILELKEKSVLNEQSLNTKISDNYKQSEFYAEFLAALPLPNALKLAPLMLKKYQLQNQEKIASKLMMAAKNNEILDLFILSKELEINENELKTLTQWHNEYKNKPLLQKYPTKISFLDSCFNGGIELAKLVLIGGDPEAGKTMLCLQILENLSKTGNKVCFFSFEFTIDDYLKRRDSNSRFLNPDNFFIVNDGYDLEDVVRNIKHLYKKGVKFFLIDSQMRVTSDNINLTIEESESRKFSTLAKLCHSLEITIFFIIQNSKGDKDNPLGSKKGGHEANIIIRIELLPVSKDDLLQKNNVFDEKKRLIILKKNKQTGKHFTEEVYFNKEELRFYAIDNRQKIESYVEFKEVENELKGPF
ncbi:MULTISPECIES: RAD55 family ATPase [unclassified Campylobacter]|uniref:RAD55 family ATPase n=1 Tax=unclassified Campylobacter TaxID=2593542 RepID=UPI0012380AEE|nr:MULTISPECIES: ATPase domain-containing protein [unclassified Campylobacter]KAA6225939.1 hypothetical protein FMM57_06960 [Campylobacter sp. LR286c]KAA6231203.1 hypothetical protein FMM58_03765 [Campylobacter sp. LR291e]